GAKLKSVHSLLDLRAGNRHFRSEDIAQATKPLIESLSNEHLIATYLLTRDSGEIALRVSTLKLLASVCRRWKDLILKSPILWTRVDSVASAYSWSLVLRLNPTGPLDVNLHGDREGERHQALLDRLGKEAHRIRSLNLDLYGYPGFIEYLFLVRKTTPSLRYLTVTNRDGIELNICITALITELPDGAPFLYLNLTDVELPWSHPRVAGLRVLDLHCRADDLPLPEEIHQILSSSLELETLQLRTGMSLPPSREPESADINPDKAFIQTLPDELLIIIYLFLREFGEMALHQLTLRILASTCRRWRKVVVGSPLLWTRLDSFATPAACALTLGRNPYGPLDLKFHDKAFQESYQVLVNFIDQEPQRIRSVNLDLAHHVGILELLLQRTTSSLRFLTITHWDAIRLKLRKCTQIPSLSEGASFIHLSLQDVQLPWTHPRLSGLRYLELSCQADRLPLPEDMYRILSLSPSLEELTLGKKPYTEVSSHPSERTKQSVVHLPIVLQHLRRIDLRDLPLPLLSLILSTLRCPGCDEVLIWRCPGEELTLMALTFAGRAIKLPRRLHFTPFKSGEQSGKHSALLTDVVRSGIRPGDKRSKVDILCVDIDADKLFERVAQLVDLNVLVHRN
ncbi:hypothetical protein FRB90_006380, partial [Tulasnella sp. 427]